MPKKRYKQIPPALSFGFTAALLGLVLCALLYSATDWNPYLIWLASWSAVAFGFYGWDKLQAKRGGRRVPEIVLHALALSGGFLGGWAGMFVFWHKVRHANFWVVLIAASAAHGALAYYWFA
jgi:uncharacterized membrane protein YsdA (DUF1294 family)